MPYLSVQEVADKLGMTVHQVYRRLRQGDLQSVPVRKGRSRYVVRSEDLDAYIAAGCPLTWTQAPVLDTWLSVRQVCQMTGYSDEMVRRLCYVGYLVYTRGAGKKSWLRIQPESVEQFVSGQPKD